tara:strand:+ start:3928 stop:4311 length:384 start_codon:yes stop_codon:yes gene_type:complete
MASVNTDIAQTLDITCRRGDTFSLTINFKQSDGTSAVNLTDYTFDMEVRSTDEGGFGDNLIPILSDEDIDIVVVSNTGGQISIGIPNSKMILVEGDVYVYDIQAVSSTGVTTTWVTGSFTVNEDVTI